MSPERVSPERRDPELPRGVALAWGVAANPQRGPKRELSIERIVDAAIEIADAEGIGAVSMSRVAASLGFTTMSLYRYVTSKDDLILLMQEGAATPPVPDETVERGWRAGVTAWVLAMRAAYREHPWLVDIPISGAPITPNSLLIVDWFLREVRALPLSDGEKMSTLLLLTSYARATGAQERDIGAAAAAAADPADVTGANYFEALAELVTPERFPYLSPLLAAGGYVAEPGAEPHPDDADDDFSFGLERILDGIEYHVGRVESGDSAGDIAAEPLPPALELPRDKQVREAAKARREAEKALREAQKREREAIKHALEREKHALEREKLAREKAERAKKE
ncbi:AcrR family transcriptional regulator [Agromyces hippuratus]|uniref:AcrR family transcriptional regulator n=1 Tax=Agromyces hippuratus TaxID=286438 RepID=A0A852WWF8_9MICO|nr:TetR/AcrR family transcriptional regulator C-terminal domain-containing protein [Agromyces hippuratus]NYG19364.1 AcrR family transcriptional regulator [Agromyces hippuratus]